MVDPAIMQGKAPAPLPDPFETVLPSGLFVKWRMPDLLRLIAFDGIVPDPMTGAVIDLLKAEKSYTSESDPMRYRHEAANIRGMLGLTQAMWEAPRFDASIEYGDGDVLGRREVGYQDHVAMFHLARFQTRNPFSAPTSPNGAERTEDAAPDSDGVRDAAGVAIGDN